MKYKIKTQNGGVTMENNNTKKLDLSVLKNKKRISMSSKEALKDVTPIDWPEDVLSGKRKVIVS
jgi:hypothetical protein